MQGRLTKSLMQCSTQDLHGVSEPHFSSLFMQLVHAAYETELLHLTAMFASEIGVTTFL
tara:strand:+ start:21557 stop:21733 length:177 start_codon:yes stop_codon:yes gene_type:complete